MCGQTNKHTFSSTVKYLNAHTGVVFLRFPKKFYRLLWSALPFITCIDTHRQNIPCFLSCLHVGGRRSAAARRSPSSALFFHHFVWTSPNELVHLFSTGTIRTCQKFLIQYNKQQLHRMLPMCKDKGEGRVRVFAEAPNPCHLTVYRWTYILTMRPPPFFVCLQERRKQFGEPSCTASFQEDKTRWRMRAMKMRTSDLSDEDAAVSGTALFPELLERI